MLIPRPKAKPWSVGVGVTLLIAVPAVIALVSGCRPTARKAPPAAAIHIHGAVPRGGREAYLGNRACIECHQQQAGQLESRHAATLAPVSGEQHAAKFQAPSNVFDPFSLTTFQTGVEGGRCVLRVKDGPPEAHVEAEYAFGSGNRGVTYLGTFQGRAVELRLSYYRKQGRWGFTPSQQAGASPTSPVGRVMNDTALEECYRCHTTALVKDGARLVPQESLLGVGCESCHGPGRDHVEAVRLRQSDLKMTKLSELRARVSVELCGQCHRAPAADDPANPVIRTHLSRFQGLALARSACFKRSEGRLSCVSCHEPHQNAEATSRTEYNAQCVSCHTPGAASHVICPSQPRGDCVSCHMPQQTVDIPTSPTFRTHWIKVWNGERPDPPKPRGSDLPSRR